MIIKIFTEQINGIFKYKFQNTLPEASVTGNLRAI